MMLEEHRMPHDPSQQFSDPGCKVRPAWDPSIMLICYSMDSAENSVSPMFAGNQEILHLSLLRLEKGAYEEHCTS